MDLSHVRRKGKQPYETVREQFDEIGGRVISRQGAPVQQGFRRFLGALDELAGRLLDDPEIAQRGQELLRETGPDGTTVPDEAAGSRAGEADGASGAPGAVASGAAADETPAPATGEASESVWTRASDEAEGPGVGESWAAENARVAGEASGASEAGGAGEAEPERTVDVVFSLPAETAAERVTLCGEFNDWSPESISLARQADGSWQVTVPLAPGSYRYKYLLDGETWENGPDADRYEENAYGTIDSVIVVS